MKLATAGIFLLTQVATTGVALAADTTASSVRGDQYYLATAKTHNMHANDHARLLGKYAAASDEPVPGSVIKEHVAAIRANTELAKESYDRLSAAAKKNPVVSKQLAEINSRLSKVDDLVDQLEAQSKHESTESKDVIAMTNALSKEMKATHLASKGIDQALIQADESSEQAAQFDNTQSPDYFFTGEGHFLD